MVTVFYYHDTHTCQSESTFYSCLDVKELLARNRRDIWSLSGSNGTQTHNHLVRKRTLNNLAKLVKWLSCVVSTICTVHLVVCYYYVAYGFQSESTLYNCLNIKELLAWKRRDIWSLSDTNGSWTHNHLVWKRSLVAVTEISDIASVLSKELLDIQVTVECRFTPKQERDMIITYNQMHRTYKYSQHRSIIWSV